MSVSVIVGGPPPPPPPDDGLRVSKQKPWYGPLPITFDDDATAEEIAHGIEKARRALAKLNE
jgi:hypothetical protein